MFIGAAGGIALSHLPGLPMIAGVAMGIGATMVAVLGLPFTSVLVVSVFLRLRLRLRRGLRLAAQKAHAALLRPDLEIDQPLARLGLPVAVAFLDRDVVADRRNAQPRQRQLARQRGLELLQRAHDLARRDLRRLQAVGSAQQHHVLEAEAVLAALAAARRDEPRGDQAGDDGPRQAEHRLDAAQGVGLHPAENPATSSRASEPVRRLLRPARPPASRAWRSCAPWPLP